MDFNELSKKAIVPLDDKECFLFIQAISIGLEK
jgi:hypothetical protein